MFLRIFMPLFLFGLLAHLGTAVANEEGGFRDCAECPEMVVVPAGSFEMGSPPDEAERGDHEGPLHEVTLQNFAIGKHEVTFDEWDACVAAGGCSHDPDDEGWGRGNHPVINVSWEDTQEYVRWLSDKTGETYRLPSESEWEYAARAGTTTRFAFGERMTEEQANIWPHLMKTTVIGSYLANAWGLYDMHGNVYEWVEDCWNDNYDRAPTDGSAWLEGDCSTRVRRSGSWDDNAGLQRSAARNSIFPDFRNYVNGFRVARTFTP